MIRSRKARWSAGIVLGAATLVTPLMALSSPASAAAGDAAGFFALTNSVNPTTDAITGSYSSSHMQIEVAVTPRDEAGLNNLLAALYTQGNPQYHKWLTEGVFDARYAPLPATVQLVENYLTSTGLKVEPSGSPFLVRAAGTSSLVSSAFRTTLSTFKDPQGKTYFSNSTPVWMPESLSGTTLGVIGLSNTARELTSAKPVITHHVNSIKRPADVKTPKSASCEEPYPTAAQQFASVNDGTPIPFGYGGGPGCQGLTPSQTNSLYNAPNVGARGKGKGVTLGLFELSAYQASDIATWAHQFYGPSYTPPLVNVNVDGGPLAPVCPVGDQCPPQFNGYAGDIEVDADIEAQLSVAPDMSNLVVYNAPNDFTGQTELDEYTAIAKDDQAAVVSSSWSVCEQDQTTAYVQAENVIFEQMASQGQSMFGAEGDTGAFSCIRSDGTTGVAVLDPPSQPWVTSVGGTSFETFNPGTNPHPRYPVGTETVWNVDGLCSNAAAAPSNDNRGGLFWCAATGAGGGGSSMYWGMPSYQRGPGVISSYTTHSTGPDGTNCILAKAGTACREDPDVSMNADEFTPYAEYCTGNANTPFSVCGTFSGSQTPPGWFGIGGTSLSSPLWSAIIADHDSFIGKRSGNVNSRLYTLFDLLGPLYFHDITGQGQSVTNNGLFPVTPGYDEATGIGTPNMTALIVFSSL